MVDRSALAAVSKWRPKLPAIRKLVDRISAINMTPIVVGNLKNR
jgi:outer membrane biosynthesis protein TonB